MTHSISTFTSATEYLLVRDQLLRESRRIDDAHAIGIIFMIENAFSLNSQIVKVNASSNGARIVFEPVIELSEDFQAQALELLAPLRAFLRIESDLSDPGKKKLMEARFEMVNDARKKFIEMANDFNDLAPLNRIDVLQHQPIVAGGDGVFVIPRGDAAQIAHALGLPRIAASIESQRLAIISKSKDPSHARSKNTRL